MPSSAARAVVACCCALLLAAAGCSTGSGVDRIVDRSTLAGRAPLDRAAVTMNGTRRELLAVIATSAGGLEWAVADDGWSRECDPPLDGLGGLARVLGASTSPTSVLATWPAVLASAAHSAASNGYTDVVVTLDREDARRVRFVAGDGAWLDLATDAAGTTVRAATGCHPVA